MQVKKMQMKSQIEIVIKTVAAGENYGHVLDNGV